MFQTVQQVTGFGKPRETESTDAHMGMRQKLGNQNNNKRRGSERQVDGKAFYDYEHNTISVQSALLFLEGFLEARLEGVFREDHDDVASYAPWLKVSVGNQNTSFAVRAYRHAAEISAKLRPIDRSTDTIRSEELKSIYYLIQDLRILLDKGVEHLKIESGSGFLEAIAESVAITKSE